MYFSLFKLKLLEYIYLDFWNQNMNQQLLVCGMFIKRLTFFLPHWKTVMPCETVENAKSCDVSKNPLYFSFQSRWFEFFSERLNRQCFYLLNYNSHWACKFCYLYWIVDILKKPKSFHTIVYYEFCSIWMRNFVQNFLLGVFYRCLSQSVLL